MEPSAHPTGRKKDWELTPRAFRRLLDWLDEGAPSEGRRYLEIRRRLAAYFDRKNCPAPDDLADETLNRVARRLGEEGEIQRDAPAKYCYIIARFVFLERLRAAERGIVALDELRRPYGAGRAQAGQEGEEPAGEELLSCLERCVGESEPRGRKIVTRYYAARERARIENRRALAAGLGVSENAL